MRLLRTFLALVGFALGGCATVNHMAFDQNASSVDVSKKSIVLIAIEVKRTDDSRFQPVPFVVKLEKPNAQSKADRDNFTLDKDRDAFVSEDGRTLFLTRMALAPGPYLLGVIDGFARAFPINGTFQIPLMTEFTVEPGSIAYVGRVSATLRPRQSGEFRAGAVVPLIDQSVAGMSTSTWDVVIDNRSDIDVPLYQKTFKALASASISVSPLAPFDRAAAQRWWDHNSKPAKAKQGTGDVVAPAEADAAAGAKP
jgi:hypothetical protein